MRITSLPAKAGEPSTTFWMSVQIPVRQRDGKSEVETGRGRRFAYQLPARQRL